PSLGKLVAAIVIGLVAIGVIVGGLYWLGNRNSGPAGNDIIAAEQGDYKQHPENAGGMNLSGEGNVRVAASEGQQRPGNLNRNGIAEQPARPGPGQTAQGPQTAQPAPARPTQTAPVPQQPARPAPQQPQRPAPAPSGPAIQLGAF